MSDGKNPKKEARVPKGKSDGAYKLKLGLWVQRVPGSMV